jgi:hypothetical protein
MHPAKLIYSVSAAYFGLRAAYYYPFLEGSHNQKEILYSEYALKTLVAIGMTPVSTVVSIFYDIPFIEKRIRKIPLEKYDTPFPYIGTYIKEEYTLNNK